MNIFRIFFVSTVLIPVLVVVATSDESGIRLRKPRSIVISEDGTRTARRHSPVNITDKNCPSLGCTGNLTTNEYNGKGTLAASTFLPRVGVDPSSPEKRFESSSSEFHHDSHRPLKLKIKSIKNSTRSDLVGYNDYIVADDGTDVGTGRGIITYAIFLSWSLFWTWRIILIFILYNTFSYFWRYMKNTYGVGEDYIEYYVKLGKDDKHPFHNYGGGWNPTFGVSLKSKIEELGWKGWQERQPGWKSPQPQQGWSGWDAHGQPHASSYHDPHHQAKWPSAYYAGWQDYGWPAPHGKKKSESEEEEDNLRHKFDKQKGWKMAKKFTKKYGKKAHKYGLRPSKYSYMFDERGNYILGGKAEGYAWRRRRSVLN